MRPIFLCCLLGGMLSSPAAHAMKAPKYERLDALAAAIGNLWQIADQLSEPLDKIEYVDGSFRFWAGSCFVPVRVEYGGSSHGSEAPAPGGGRWSTTVGKAQCQ